MKKVFITDYFKDNKIEKKIFKNYAEVQSLNLVAKSKIPKIIEKANGLLVWHTQIDYRFLLKLKNCSTIVRYGVGCDNIDLKTARKLNIDCANTPDYGVDEVAETASAMILSLTRKILQLNSNSKKYQKSWQENVLYENKINPIRRLSDYKLGIIGLGRIGSLLALKMKNFNMQVGFYDPYVKSGHDKIIGIKKFRSIKNLVSECDIVSINCVLTSETKNLVNSKFINSMKPGSILINTARGKILEDVDHIYNGLIKGNLSGVGLDVLPEEPPNKKSKLIKLWKNNKHKLSSNIIINPHAGYYSSRSVVEMREKASENLLRALKDGYIENLVN